MKPRTKNEWLSLASGIHAHLSKVRKDIDAIFPNQQYLQPLNHLSAAQQLRLNKFLGFNVSQLVPYTDLKKMLFHATSCGVDKGNILYLELETTVEHV